MDFTSRQLKAAPKQKSLMMLDVGGSDGSLAWLSHESLLSVGISVSLVVLDLSLTSLQKGRKIYSDLCFIRGDVTHLPFKPNAFDVVCSYSVFEHLERPDSAAREMARASSSLCIVQIPNMHYIIEPHTKTPLLHLFPSLVRKKIGQVTGVPYLLNFNASPSNLTSWFRQAKFNVADALDVYHAKWTRLLRIPQGYLYAFKSQKTG